MQLQYTCSIAHQHPFAAGAEQAAEEAAQMAEEAVSADYLILFTIPFCVKDGGATTTVSERSSSCTAREGSSKDMARDDSSRDTATG